MKDLDASNVDQQEGREVKFERELGNIKREFLFGDDCSFRSFAVIPTKIDQQGSLDILNTNIRKTISSFLELYGPQARKALLETIKAWREVLPSQYKSIDDLSLSKETKEERMRAFLDVIEGVVVAYKTKFELKH